MLNEVIEKVIAHHPDFTYNEVKELCEDFLSQQDPKIKEETKFKRLNKYLDKEFELDETHVKKDVFKEYDLENIPKYLFTGKSQIVSSLITIKDLTKNIEKTELFHKANFKINNNEKVALIGKNGCGKTTLLKMILGVEEINDGIIELASGLKIGYLSQDLFWKSKDNTLRQEMLEIFPEINQKIYRLEELKDHPLTPSIQSDDNSYLVETDHPLTPLIQSKDNSYLLETDHPLTPSIQSKDNSYLVETDHPLTPSLVRRGESPDWEEIEKLSKELIEIDGFKKYNLQLEILKYFGFTESQLDFNVLQLSGGEQTKVQIAKFLIQEVDILILDEPTNHLDINGIMFLERFCRNWKKAILSISHDIRFINNTSTKIAEISGKKINIYPGNYEQYLIEKEANFNKDMKDYVDQQRDIQKQTDYINRFRANSAKASSVQSRIKALDKVEILDKPENESKVKSIQIHLDKRLPEIIMKLYNVEVGYTTPIVKMPEYIEVYKSDKIGIIGKNGAGKSTYLKTILGEIEALNGKVEINENLTIGSYSQVLENLDMELSIIDELKKDFENEKHIRTVLGGLLITGEKVEQFIKTLSGGERAKVALTKMLLSKPHIIVMDEPTNHLDLHSKEVIKEMLEGFHGTTIIVSHDRDLLHSVSNKVWLIRDGGLDVFNEPEVGFAEVFGE
ncbi:MAG: ABC-F family ATP-binding cassette domain-containing protein [Candidatus Gracilibacteria bacterium]|nr:ABC-F family ATP-binding cassette domain-containing protein [Candidatus Gracilibacteria bacterium]